MSSFSYLGFGLGLRHQHYRDVLANRPPVDWFEIMTEDYLVAGGNTLHYLNQIREHYPVVMHGVSLSIGSAHPLDMEYLKQVKQLAKHLQPAWVSDHLCWTGTNGVNMHDLLPLPYTEDALNHVVQRVKQVQEMLELKILLENVSSYVTFKDSEFTEWEFLTQVVEQADCHILLDINNVYVSGFNHGFDPHDYLNGIPVSRVQQFHLAGHEDNETHLIDTHDHDIIPHVWALYEAALKRFGQVSTLIERDDHIPPVADLVAELEQARRIAQKVQEQK
jgi:uncharacterized protein (UPF0276 family)